MNFQEALNKLVDYYKVESKHYNLTKDTVLGIYCRKVQKVETKASSNSNIQENTAKISDFFPVLENSELFPHTRLKVPAVAPSSSLNRKNAAAGSVLDDLVGHINYRRKTQNGSPYIQLSVGEELSQLKSAMLEGDELIFVRFVENQDYKYLVLLSSESILGAHRSVWMNDALKGSKTIKPMLELEYTDLNAQVAINQSQYNKIYFGAPGTGKSFKLREDRKDLGITDDSVEVVTFYPDYDYYSFVGGYKPTNGNTGIEYSFVEQAFIRIYEAAWDAIEKGQNDRLFLLIIEEINRGNCAEIFGDIFQLLDRNPNYAISASKELREYLVDKFDENHLSIRQGKLHLPPNLLIWATMNTSDQSLFPLDSAFKRRWSWEYLPISYETDSAKNPSAAFRINLNEKDSFSWLQFIEKTNGLIRDVPHLGEDKCLGNYFINPPSGSIELDEFVNKVLFYIWCDVFKDEENQFYEGASFYDLFKDEGGKEKLVAELLAHLDVDIN